MTKTNIGRIIIWEMNGDVIGHIQHNAAIKDFQISPDGKLVATLGEDNSIHIWTIKGEQIAQYSGYRMAFNADWSKIATANPADNSVTISPVNDLDGLLRRSCQWLRIYMTHGPASEAEQKICQPYL